jgi:hypothetical protein
MIMDAESRRLHKAVVVVTVNVIHITLAGYGGESHIELGIIAWHLGPNSVPSEYQLTNLISNPKSNL